MTEFHIVFGPQGAGKTTCARELAARVAGVRFSIDEWMVRLHGADAPMPLNFSWVMERVRRCEVVIWATACDLARSGVHVVLDLGLMHACQRDEWRQRIEELGHAARFHFVTAPRDERRARVLQRNAERGSTFAFEVSAAMFEAMERQFEPPTPGERKFCVPACRPAGADTDTSPQHTIHLKIHNGRA